MAFSFSYTTSNKAGRTPLTFPPTPTGEVGLGLSPIYNVLSTLQSPIPLLAVTSNICKVSILPLEHSSSGNETKYSSQKALLRQKMQWRSASKQLILPLLGFIRANSGIYKAEADCSFLSLSCWQREQRHPGTRTSCSWRCGAATDHDHPWQRHCQGQGVSQECDEPWCMCVLV